MANHEYKDTYDLTHLQATLHASDSKATLLDALHRVAFRHGTPASGSLGHSVAATTDFLALPHLSLPLIGTQGLAPQYVAAYHKTMLAHTPRLVVAAVGGMGGHDALTSAFGNALKHASETSLTPATPTIHAPGDIRLSAETLAATPLLHAPTAPKPAVWFGGEARLDVPHTATHELLVAYPGAGLQDPKGLAALHVFAALFDTTPATKHATTTATVRQILPATSPDGMTLTTSLHAWSDISAFYVHFAVPDANATATTKPAYVSAVGATLDAMGEVVATLTDDALQKAVRVAKRALLSMTEERAALTTFLAKQVRVRAFRRMGLG